MRYQTPHRQDAIVEELRSYQAILSWVLILHRDNGLVVESVHAGQYPNC